MAKKLTRQQLEKRTATLLADIVPYLKAEMPEGIGFALFMFDFGEKGNIAYASSAKREDMIKGVREWLAHVED